MILSFTLFANIMISSCIFVAMNGVVVKTTGKHYTVKTTDGNIISCGLKGRFRIKGIKSTNPIVVGDIVHLIQDVSSWMITGLEERRNCIVRRSVNLSKQTHIIAANIDQAILMITLDQPVTTTGFIDRFLIAANSNNIEVVLIFNKSDIYDKDKIKQKNLLLEIYRNIGYKVFSYSILRDDLSAIKSIMKNKISMISGHSGVGKSTLINKLQPSLNIKTKEVSSTHNQGQHTTTFSEIHDLDFGGSIIDTPGIKGFGLSEIEYNDLGSFFPEFLSFKQGCKYNNCIHKNEPDCEVKIAVQKGDIAKSRYENYLNMLDDDSQNYRINNY